jgi:hypothetical protein
MPRRGVTRAQRIADVLETHSIAYRVVGSLASMAYGEPRFTNDIDILADVRPEHVQQLLLAFPDPEYCLAESAMRSAIGQCGQFDIIHIASGIKADVIDRSYSGSWADRLGVATEWQACLRREAAR